MDDKIRKSLEILYWASEESVAPYFEKWDSAGTGLSFEAFESIHELVYSLDQDEMLKAFGFEVLVAGVFEHTDFEDSVMSWDDTNLFPEQIGIVMSAVLEGDEAEVFRWFEEIAMDKVDEFGEGTQEAEDLALFLKSFEATFADFVKDGTFSRIREMIPAFAEELLAKIDAITSA